MEREKRSKKKEIAKISKVPEGVGLKSSVIEDGDGRERRLDSERQSAGMGSKTARAGGTTPAVAMVLLLLSSSPVAPSLAASPPRERMNGRMANSAHTELSPVLSPIGVAQVVWNQTRDACPYSKWVNGVPRPCEEPDSMPIAWHNPSTKARQLLLLLSANFLLGTSTRHASYSTCNLVT